MNNQVVQAGEAAGGQLVEHNVLHIIMLEKKYIIKLNKNLNTIITLMRPVVAQRYKRATVSAEAVDSIPIRRIEIFYISIFSIW